MKLEIEIRVIDDNYCSYWMDSNQFNRLSGLSIKEPSVALGYRKDGEITLTTASRVLNLDLDYFTQVNH